MQGQRLSLVVLIASFIAGAITPAADAADRPIVIAHRGASGYLPEHTLEAYALAYGLGADYIEPDLVRTKDGAFICLHDIHLEATTNVEAVYPDRKRKDGRWYAADFTLEEVKRLQVHDRLDGRFPTGRADFEVPAFEEMIELVQGLNQSTGRSVGIYPELKAPRWHREAGLPMEAAFLDILRRYGYEGPNAKVFVQCFEAEPLKRMREELGSQLPQIMLIGSRSQARAHLTRAGLRELAAFADGIGPSKNLIAGDPVVVTWAHELGLKVHPYTFRADQVPPRFPSHEAELRRFIEVYEVDGLFTDFPDRARKWIDNRP